MEDEIVRRQRYLFCVEILESIKVVDVIYEVQEKKINLAPVEICLNGLSVNSNTETLKRNKPLQRAHLT